MNCECGAPFKSQTMLAVHKLQGACPLRKRPSKSKSTGVSRDWPRVERDPVDPNKIRWHASYSVYYTVDDLADHELGEETKQRLHDAQVALDQAMQALEAEGITIDRVRGGYNSGHCRLNQYQQLFNPGSNK